MIAVRGAIAERDCTDAPPVAILVRGGAAPAPPR